MPLFITIVSLTYKDLQQQVHMILPPRASSDMVLRPQVRMLLMCTILWQVDLRIYVLVTSVDPLRVFLYHDGLLRMSTEKYSHPTDSNVVRIVGIIHCGVWCVCLPKNGDLY